MSEEEIQIVEKMKTYGNPFVQALADCFYNADLMNFKKLRKAFPEYWEEYKNFEKDISRILTILF